MAAEPPTLTPPRYRSQAEPKTLLLGVCLALASLLCCCRGRAEERLDGQAGDPASAPIGTPLGAYVGSGACRSCHEALYETWAKSPHHGTLRPVSSTAAPRVLGRSFAGGFTVDSGGNVEGPSHDGGKARGTAAYLVGVRRREDLWVRMADGRLQVFPYSFDLDAGEPLDLLREVSGGFEPPHDSADFWTRVGRNADLNCYGCHATGHRIEIAGASPAGNAVPRSRWKEPGVGCEACHGPGGPHVQAAQAGRAESRPPITGKEGNAEDRVGVCASCHGLRDLLHSPLNKIPAQAPGVAIWELGNPLVRTTGNAEFRTPFFTDLRPGTFQQEAIALGQSGCVRKGGLTCAQCHDVHSGVLTPRAMKEDACLPCHEKIVSRSQEHAGHAPGTPGGMCLDCHMARIVRGPGKFPARDHTLAPPIAGPGEVPAACASCHRGKEGQPEKIIRGWAALNRQGIGSRRRLAISGAIDGSERGDAKAIGLLLEILDDESQGWFIRTAVTEQLGTMLAPGQGQGAANPVRRALLDPNPALKRAAIRALARFRDARDEAALVRLVSDPNPFLALEAVQALEALRVPNFDARLVQLVRRPDLAGEYQGHLVLGQTALRAKDWPRAEQSFLRALEVYPYSVRAITGLGAASLGQGQIPRARDLWTQALELSPRYEPARKNLEETASR